MKLKHRIGITHYPVSSNLANAQQQISVSSVVECIIDAASRHAERWGFGYHDLKANNHAWVLARLAFEMSRYPRVDETLTIETWVESINKRFSTRNFRLLDQNLNVVGFARSVWSIIDFTTRRGVDLTAYDAIGKLEEDLPCPIDPPGRINVSGEHVDVCQDYRVSVSDLDINRHMTSARYIEHLLDLFSLERFDTQIVERFEVQYLNEARYGDAVALLRQQTSEHAFELEMKRDDGTSLCKCKCLFNPNSLNNKD